MSSNRNTVDGGYAWVILIACTLLYMTLVGTCKAFGILYNEFLEKYDAGAGNTAWISSLMFFLCFALACTLLYMTLVGTCKAFGILYNEFLEKYDAGAGNTAWISSLMFFLCFALGPLANYLVGVFSFRAVVMFGGLLVSIGYFISAFVPRMEWMFLTIGVICGFGSGLAFAPCGTIVSFYFVKRRALANGIMVSGSGLSSFVFPYLYQYCIDTFSVTGAMIIISGVILHMCVAGALLRQPLELTDNHTPFDQSTVDEKQGHKETRTTEKTCNVYLKLLRNTRLTMFIMVFTINILAYAANFVAFPAHMQSLGFHENEVALAFSMIGAAEVLTRALFGWFADKKYISNSVIMIFSGVASGTAAILLPCFKTFPVMVAYGLAVGIFPGAFWSLMAVVLLDCVPLIELTSAFGLLYIFMSSAIAFSQPGMGWIEDATGDWNLSFRMMGTFHFLTAAILLAEPLILKLFCYDFGDKEKRDDHEEEIEEYVKTSDIARRSSTIRHDNYDSKEHVKVSLIRERDIIAENETKSSHPTSKDDDRSELLAPIAATEEIDV